ncbi:MAG: Rieske (2Fe-2S) protein [Isosphaeraceae bacterium]
MGSFQRICQADEIEEGKGKAVEIDGLRLAVFRNEGRFHALFGRCPHANGSMGLGWLEEGEVVCPLHRWRFRLESGRCTTVRGESIHVFRCEQRGDEIWVEV